MSGKRTRLDISYGRFTLLAYHLFIVWDHLISYETLVCMTTPCGFLLRLHVAIPQHANCVYPSQISISFQATKHKDFDIFKCHVLNLNFFNIESN